MLSTNWLLLFGAYSHASISVATAVYNTQPFMLVVFGALLFGERVTLAKLGWLATAFVGMLLIVQAKPGVSLPGGDYALGIAMALGAAFFWAVASVIAKRLTGTPPHLIALVQVAVGVLMLAPFARLGTPPQGASTWLLLVTLGVVHTGLMYILLYGAVQKLPTYLQGALSFIYPVVAIGVDFVAFGHRLQPAQWLGAAAILLAAAEECLVGLRRQHLHALCGVQVQRLQFLPQRGGLAVVQALQAQAQGRLAATQTETDLGGCKLFIRNRLAPAIVHQGLQLPNNFRCYIALHQQSNVKHPFLRPQGLGGAGMHFIIECLPQRVGLGQQVAFVHGEIYGSDQLRLRSSGQAFIR